MDPRRVRVSSLSGREPTRNVETVRQPAAGGFDALAVEERAVDLAEGQQFSLSGEIASTIKPRSRFDCVSPRLATNKSQSCR